MLLRALTFTLAFLVPLATVGSTKTNVPASPDGSGSTPEGVVVSAPEPRYVAPTLRDQIGRVWAPVYINGRGPFRLVLDTGANSSAVIASLASRLGAPIVPGALKLHGVTGSSLVPAIHVDSLEVGDLWLGNRQLAVVEDVFGGAEGVLGADGLRDMRVFIDFRHDRISIRRSGTSVISSKYTRVPISIKDQHLLMFNVKVAGVRTKALLDTGAQRTIGNRSLQAALERKARRGVASNIIGVTLDVQQGHTYSAPPVRVKDITIRGMHITFGDMYIFDAWDMTKEPALLIGMDIIGLLDSLIIDYKKEELYLRARR